MTTPVICLTGPTAAGKSASTLALAQRWPIEIITVDSATIYRGMDIGTAKPSLADQKAIRHHLLDIRDPVHTYSASEFRHDAGVLIGKILARERIPVLVGGTMLYYKALREGLHDLPPADAAVRRQIDLEAKKIGWPALHDELASYDPVTASRLAPNDSQRLQRAIEIYRVSGQPMSHLLAAPVEAMHAPYSFFTISLEPSDRLALHTRIDQRYHTMLERGLLDEVSTLYARGDLHSDLPSVRCVGYRQLWAHLEGDLSLDSAIEQAIAATRQLAKRQLTWLRSQPERAVIDCLQENVADRVVDQAASVLGCE